MLLRVCLLIVACLALGHNRGMAQGIPDSLLRRQADSLLADSIVRQVDSLSRAGALREIVLPDSTAPKLTARTWTLSGQVLEKNSREPVPFALLNEVGSTAGETTDLDGKFQIVLRQSASDSVRITAMGFIPAYIRLNPLRPVQTLTIELERRENELDEVVIRPGIDPALKLMRKVVAAKPINDPEKLQSYACELYNKLEVDIQRLTRAQFEKLPGMKPFAFIYDNLDTVSEEVPFLPFFLTESLSDYYFQSDPRKSREVVKASLVKGIKNEGITQFLGGMYLKLNAYKNRIPVFDKNFVSPLSDNGELYYKYKIADTQTVYGRTVYRVQYAPKRTGENCFFGDFWVVDSAFAVQRISLELPSEANINWVSRLSLYQEYVPLADTLWAIGKDKFVVDFKLPYATKKLPGFIARKTAIYRKYEPGSEAANQGLENPAYHRDVVITDTATQTGEDFWESARPETLSKNERAIYRTADTLQNMPVFVRTKNWIRLLTTGYKEFGGFDLGPVFSFYSRNPIEGHRLRVGGSTNEKLFKDVQLEGYVAYGTGDNRWKYKATAFWIMERDPRMALYAAFTHDVDRSTSYYNESSNFDNILSNVLRKGQLPWRLAFRDEARLEWRKEYFSGFSHRLIATRRGYTPYAPLPTNFYNAAGEAVPELVSTEIGITLRLAYQEKFVNGHFRRASLGSNYPVPELRYFHGFQGKWAGGYSYDKVSLTVNHFMRLGGFGKGNITVFGGKVFGTLPYPLLEIHPGNDFYSYSARAFNMMNRYEFLSDSYAGLMWEHNIGGGLFTYIPLLKKAKLRQFWTAKGVVGSLSNANKQLNLNKGFPFRTLEGKPYLELGTGVENIFQLLRVDFIWRVTPAPLPDEDRNRYFGVFGSLKLEF